MVPESRPYSYRNLATPPSVTEFRCLADWPLKPACPAIDSPAAHSGVSHWRSAAFTIANRTQIDLVRQVRSVLRMNPSSSQQGDHEVTASTSSVSPLTFGVEVAESGAGVVGGEVPVDLTLGGVRGLLSGGEFDVEHGEVVDTAVEALAGECGQFDLGDGEPGAVFGGVVDLQALGQCERGGWVEGFVEGRDGVGVEVVHHQHDLLGFGVVDVEEPLDLPSPVDLGPAGLGVHPPKGSTQQKIEQVP